MLMGLCRMLNYGNGQDLAVVVICVNESGLKLVDDICLPICNPPKQF